MEKDHGLQTRGFGLSRSRGYKMPLTICANKVHSFLANTALGATRKEI